jgi:hypothetical protein
MDVSSQHHFLFTGISQKMNEKPGCLPGLGKLFLLNWLFDWLQKRFGFGRRASVTGCGCGILLAIIFVIFACQIITGTDWTRLF